MVLGALTMIMVFGRVFWFRLYESPRFLMMKGRYEEAIGVLEKLAKLNGKVISLTANDLAAAAHLDDKSATKQGWLRENWKRVRILFEKDLIVTTILVWCIFTLIALGTNMFFLFLPTFLSATGTEQLSISDTYRNYLIASIFPIFGPIIAKYISDTFLGRKYSMALSSIGVASSLFVFTLFRTSGGQLIATCIAGTLLNLLYAVLYVYTPEV